MILLLKIPSGKSFNWLFSKYLATNNQNQRQKTFPAFQQAMAPNRGRGKCLPQPRFVAIVPTHRGGMREILV